MSVDLSKMTKEEKEAHIEAVEMMIDYGNGNVLSDDDIELYNQLISERSQKTEANEKDTLDSVIASAEKRRDEQNEIDTEQIDREAR